MKHRERHILIGCIYRHHSHFTHNFTSRQLQNKQASVAMVRRINLSNETMFLGKIRGEF